jgi:hypothetical protein
MSPSLRPLRHQMLFCTAVRVALVRVAPIALGSVLAFVALMALHAKQAWAGSPSGWAPMCDLDAATVVAPLIAPPVEAGEITRCPDGTVLEDFDQMSILQGSGPEGEPEPGLGLDAPSPRVLPVTSCITPSFKGLGELLEWPGVRLGPAAAFGSVPERPPCV